MEENMNEMIEDSVENNVVEDEPQETPDTTVVNNVYLVKTVDDVAAARKSFITGASYVLGASFMTATIGGVTFIAKKIKSRIKKHKEAKKRDAEIEEELDKIKSCLENEDKENLQELFIKSSLRREKL